MGFGKKDGMNQDRLMRLIRKNLMAVAVSQRQSKARGESIDQRMTEISAEQKRIAQELGRGHPTSKGRHKKH